MKTPHALLFASLVGVASLPAQTLTWTQRVTGVAAGLRYTAAAYGNGRYAVTAYGNGATPGTFQSQVASSADGITWSVVTLPTAPVVRGIAYGNGLWLVPAERNGTDAGNTQNILTSADGVTWTARTTGVGSLWKVAHTTVGAGSLFVAVGLAGASPNTVYSSDATTWTRVSVGGAGVNLGQLAAGNGAVVAAGDTGGTVYTTTNGSTWATVALPGLGATNTVTGLAFAGGEFIASVRADDGTTRIFTSANGTTWSAFGASSGAATPGGFGANGLGASGNISGGTSRVIVAGSAIDVQTFASVPQILTATGALTAWTAQQFGGGGSFVSNNFAFFANNLWLVGNNNTQLFTTAETAGGGGGGGGSTQPPVISVGPVAQTATVGVAVAFSVTANGTGLSYQWLFNDAAIAGATNPTYAIAAVTTAHAGNYSVRLTNAGGTVTSAPAALTVNTAPAGFAFLNNLSVRARAGSGSETLIVGVTVGGGSVNTAKSVLIRGIGPALTAFGVAGALADPVITVLSGATVIASNDDWDAASGIAATNAAVGAFPLPAGSRDSALLGSGLGGGGYTVQLTGKAGATGNALVELYDTAAAATITAGTSRFTNLSARTVGGTGSETLIVGFNVAGTGTRRLVFRAVGPGLAAFGVAGTMPDPKLELYNGPAKIGENDNWEAATLAAQQAVGAFALTTGSRDAVLVSALSPGSYTVQVTGGTAGIVLVEAYEAP